MRALALDTTGYSRGVFAVSGVVLFAAFSTSRVALAIRRSVAVFTAVVALCDLVLRCVSLCSIVSVFYAAAIRDAPVGNLLIICV